MPKEVCRRCDYPYVPYHGKRKGKWIYGNCPNCGFNNTRDETFGEALEETGENIKTGCGFIILALIVFLIISMCSDKL